MMTGACKPSTGGVAEATAWDVSTLAAKLGAELVNASDGDAAVTGVQQDSRRVVPGDMFVALRGGAVDGARFVTAAAAAGATAMMIEPAQLPAVTTQLRHCPLLVVERPRQALAQAAALVYGKPTEQLCVVGITGTNGKTTTASLLAAALNDNGARAAVVGTLGYHFDGVVEASRHTSPEADELQRVAAGLLRRGASHLVMEVSSIALAAQRVAEVAFDVAAFTNLSQDHLNYHGDMRRYAAAKDTLFFQHQPAIVVVNVDDEHGRSLAGRLRDNDRAKLWRYSTRLGRAAEVTVRSLRTTIDGIEMMVHYPQGAALLRSPMLGDHNAENLLAAFTIALSLGVDGQRACAALGRVSSVDGRLERVAGPPGSQLVALVDFAHTPDALQRTLTSLRAMTDGKIVCVFGCGGDRDRDKRAPMGQRVAELADMAIVTNDNPRSEAPAAIAAAIVAGIERCDDARYLIELDRERAIHIAVDSAAPGDIVLVAGKGHENYQINGRQTRPFDDRVVLAAALARRGGAR